MHVFGVKTCSILQRYRKGLRMADVRSANQASLGDGRVSKKNSCQPSWKHTAAQNYRCPTQSASLQPLASSEALKPDLDFAPFLPSSFSILL